MLGIGLLCGIINCIIISGIQTVVPSEKLGRTLGILGTMSGSAAPIAMGLSGVILDHIDKRIDLVFYFGAVCFILTTLLASLNKEFRNLSVDSSESAIRVVH